MSLRRWLSPPEKRIDGLAQPEVTEADILQQLEPAQSAPRRRFVGVRHQHEQRRVDGGVEQIRDAPVFHGFIGQRGAQFDFKNVRAIAAAIALGAADEHVAEELHFNLFKARAAAAFALALRRIETERAG
jgi:hypothetical protein